MCLPCTDAAHETVACWAGSTLWKRKTPFLGQTQCLAKGTGQGEESKVGFSPQPAQRCSVDGPIVLLIQQQNWDSVQPHPTLKCWSLTSKCSWGCSAGHIKDHYSGFPSGARLWTDPGKWIILLREEFQVWSAWPSLWPLTAEYQGEGMSVLISTLLCPCFL